VKKFDSDCRQFKVFESSSRQGSQRRNAVPLPAFDEVHESGTGRGVLMKVKL